MHPQSVVHSMVELVDGSTMAQLSMPDMRLPIGYAMGWPERLATAFGAIDWSGPPDAHLRAARPGGVRLPRPRLPAGRRAGVRPGLAQRGQRGGGGRVPRRPARVAGHRRGGGRHPGRLPRAGHRPASTTSSRPTGQRRRVAESSVARRRERGVTDTVEAPPAGSPRAGPRAAPGQCRRRWSAWRWLVATVVALFLLLGWGTLLVVIVAIVVIVMVHELGHFATAKWSRMKVTEYFVGFGPRLWSVRRGETEYGVKAIPAGGYVKIPGMTNLEEIDPADEARTYRQQPFHNRIIVACAGSFMHFVMAFLLAYGAVLFFGIPTSAEHLRVTGFVPWAGHTQTAAQEAGLRSGDVIAASTARPSRSPHSSATCRALRRTAGAPHGRPGRSDRASHRRPRRRPPRGRQRRSARPGQREGQDGRAHRCQHRRRRPRSAPRARCGPSARRWSTWDGTRLSPCGRSPKAFGSLYSSLTNSKAADAERHAPANAPSRSSARCAPPPRRSRTGSSTSSRS